MRDLERLGRSCAEAGGDSPRVLVAALRNWTTHTAYESVIAQALRLRGANVALVTCGGGQPLCELGWSRQVYPLPCDRCAWFTDRIVSAARLPHFRLADEFPWDGDGRRAPVTPETKRFDPHEAANITRSVGAAGRRTWRRRRRARRSRTTPRSPPRRSSPPPSGSWTASGRTRSSSSTASSQRSASSGRPRSRARSARSRTRSRRGGARSSSRTASRLRSTTRRPRGRRFATGRSAPSSAGRSIACWRIAPAASARTSATSRKPWTRPTPCGRGSRSRPALAW